MEYQREVEILEETENGSPIAVLLTYTEPGGRAYVKYERVFPIMHETELDLYPISFVLN